MSLQFDMRVPRFRDEDSNIGLRTVEEMRSLRSDGELTESPLSLKSGLCVGWPTRARNLGAFTTQD